MSIQQKIDLSDTKRNCAKFTYISIMFIYIHAVKSYYDNKHTV